jgi:TolB-like protein
MWFQRGGATNDKEWLVAPFEVQGPDRSLDWLREGSLSTLTAALSQWKDLHVVEYERTLDLLRDADLGDAKRVGLEQARTIARRVGAGRVVMGQVMSSGDSIIVTAKLFDVDKGNALDEARIAVKTGTDPRSVFESVASELLNIAGGPRLTFDLAKQTTTSVEAYRLYLEGVKHQNSWRLEQADTAFQRAIAADSTFALAYYKRSLGLGWMQVMDTSRVNATEMSVQYAERLPNRMQELVRGHAELSRGFIAGFRGDTTQTQAGFLASRERLAKLVRADSLDAEAWYALADADYHLVWSTSYGRSADSTAKYLNESMMGFRRTIQLDSSFHLAYQHLVEMYNQASIPRSYLLLVGDTIKPGGLPEVEKRVGTPEQVAALRAAAAVRARDAAVGWVTTDPDARSARRVLADNLIAANMTDSAIHVLEAAMQRPTTADPSFPWRVEIIKARAFKPGAGPAVAAMLGGMPPQVMASMRDQDRAQMLMSVVKVGGLTGRPALVSDAMALMQKYDPMLPGASPAISTRALAPLVTIGMRGAMGIVPTSAEASQFESALRQLQKEAGDTRTAIFPYLLYLATRNETYSTMAHTRMPTDTSKADQYPELTALVALQKGDTATAQRVARTFPTVDSLRRANIGSHGMRVMARAMVVSGLGDDRRAVEMLEAIDPARFPASQDIMEPTWPMYVRSHLRRGQLYERIGEAAKAIAAYEKFVSLWPDADGPVAAQVKEARMAVARLRDRRS